MNSPVYSASNLRTTRDMLRRTHMYPMVEFKYCCNVGHYQHWLAVQVEDTKAIMYTFDVIKEDGDDRLAFVTVSETTFAELVSAWTASLLNEEPNATLTVYPR